MKFNYDSVVDKLHHMNKARYELETKLTDSHEQVKNLQEISNVQKETLVRR
jgi:Mg2+ and Co2+ transporter CorA